jgi:hypothetical protein
MIMGVTIYHVKSITLVRHGRNSMICAMPQIENISEKCWMKHLDFCWSRFKCLSFKETMSWWSHWSWRRRRSRRGSGKSIKKKFEVTRFGLNQWWLRTDTFLSCDTKDAASERFDFSSFFVLRVMRQTNGKHKHLLVEHVLPMFIVSLSLSQHVWADRHWRMKSPLDDFLNLLDFE